jgi:hypothetical protein
MGTGSLRSAHRRAPYTYIHTYIHTYIYTYISESALEPRLEEGRRLHMRTRLRRWRPKTVGLQDSRPVDPHAPCCTHVCAHNHHIDPAHGPCWARSKRCMGGGADRAAGLGEDADHLRHLRAAHRAPPQPRLQVPQPAPGHLVTAARRRLA